MLKNTCSRSDVYSLSGKICKQSRACRLATLRATNVNNYLNTLRVRVLFWVLDLSSPVHTLFQKKSGSPQNWLVFLFFAFVLFCFSTPLRSSGNIFYSVTPFWTSVPCIWDSWLSHYQDDEGSLVLLWPCVNPVGSIQEWDLQIWCLFLKKPSEEVGSMGTLVLVCRLLPPTAISSPLNIVRFVARSKDTIKKRVTDDGIKV